MATVSMIFGRDDPLEKHDLLGFYYLAIHDFSIDFCVEVAVLTPADYSLETPH